MTYAQIIGTGLYAPERVVPNSHFDALYGEDVGTFLREKRNISERRYAADDEVTSDLVVEAVRAALANAGRTPAEVDLLIVATDTPDYLSPSTAAVAQHKLGLPHAGTFDLNTACAGFVTALDVGAKYVTSDPAQYGCVVVVGAYLMSRFLDFGVRNIATLFADGAGAVVLAPGDAPGVLTGKLETKGQYHDYMGLYVGGTHQPPTVEGVADGAHRLQFRQKFPRTFNLENWAGMTHRLCDAIGVTPADVDRYVFTQINIGSIEETMAALDLPMDRAHNVMDRYGYTGSACVPMALADAAAQHKLRENDLVFLIASGGGAAIAGTALRWRYDT